MEIPIPLSEYVLIRDNNGNFISMNSVTNIYKRSSPFSIKINLCENNFDFIMGYLFLCSVTIKSKSLRIYQMKLSLTKS